MNIKNFNINNILKNSSAKQRAMILFDEVTKINFLYESNLSESERDILLDSFKTSQEIDIYNEYYTNYNRLELLISEIEKSQLKIENSKLILSIIIDNIYEIGEIVNHVISSLDDVLSQDIIKKNKEEKFIRNVADLMVLLNEKNKVKIVNNLHQKKGKKDENEVQTFVRLFQTKIEQQLYYIKTCKESLEVKYSKFDIKYKAVDQKINEINQDIKLTKDFINGFCKIFTNDIKESSSKKSS